MKVPNVELKIRDLELIDFMDRVQTILNAGLYTMRVLTASPDWVGENGEHGILVSGSTGTLYIYADQWMAVGLGSVTGAISGTYTPTLTTVANLATATTYSCQFMRVENMVTVSGRVDVDPTLTATATSLGISLPIVSDFSVPQDCGGIACSPGIAGQVMAILGDATNNRATMAWIAGDITNQTTYFNFTYRVI